MWKWSHCVRPLVVELGSDAQRVQALVRVLQSSRLLHGAGQPGRRAQSRDGVEVEGHGADRGELDGGAAVADLDGAALAAEAAQGLGARLGGNRLHRAVE